MSVLIVGAGPTGLVLALWLKRLGIASRIIDKTAEPGTTSRALAVHARTLELYRQLDLDAETVERGLRLGAVNLWAHGAHVGRLVLGEMGRGLSPFPFMLMLPQDEHERMLIEHLTRVGVEIERRTELVSFQERGDRIAYRTRCGERESEGEASFIVGCDGAHSIVRETLGLGFPGGTYERVFYVADVELTGAVANHELHVALDDADFLAVFPMKGKNIRLIGTIERNAEDATHLAWDDVSHNAVSRLDLEVEQVNWFSTYRVHHRVAEHFRRGRAFLAGDAAHIHSPVGGQGMNTGIGDAVNLAWKLAAVERDAADPSILDTYEVERIAFARRLVSSTDRAFTFATRDGLLARFVRLDLFPAVVPAVVNLAAVRRFMFRTVSQTLVRYRSSALSEGKAGAVWGGDRLPWVELEDGTDNFRPLRSVDWQVHVYGTAEASVVTLCAARSLAIHVFAWRPSMRAAGLEENSAYLVRPDGYVGLAGATAASLGRYLDERRVKLGWLETCTS